MNELAAPPAGALAATRDLVLTCNLSPGDVVMMTAAVRDLHLAHPGRFRTAVRTSVPTLWENNPYIVDLDPEDPGVETIPMHYPLIQQSNEGPHHFIHGYVRHLEETLGVRIPVTKFKGDVHLSDLEKSWISQVQEAPIGWHHDFWIIVAGGKHDFTAKWWDPARYQAVVDHFAGRIQFVQCGEASHWHTRLKGVIDLVGRTDVRQFVRLMHHAVGVICPVTFAMHLAAAVEVRPGRPLNRACVVVAGGREPSQWEKYGHHRFLETNGALRCCDNGGCWKPRCQTIGDGDEKDRPENLCIAPVAVSPSLVIPRCLDMISTDDVIRAVEQYYEGGALNYLKGTRGHVVRTPLRAPAAPTVAPASRPTPAAEAPATRASPGLKAAFLTITDHEFFPGTLATVNSIFHFHPDAKVLVVENPRRRLNDPQRALLERGGATIVDGDRFAVDDRYIGPWELKAYAVCDLAPEYELLIGVDSDCVLCSPVDDAADHARRTGRFVGGKDGDGARYDEAYALYGIAPGTDNPKYMSASIYFCPTTPENLAILRDWARCTDRAVYNGRGPYPGHGDQGLLNALIFAARGGDGVDLLDNTLWSQHGVYWHDVIAFENGRCLNRTRGNARQRAMHCGGTWKFWSPAHREAVTTRHTSQAFNYAWWLYMLWFGRCSDRSADPAEYLPEPSRHIIDDLANFFGMIRPLADGLTLAPPGSTGLLSRMTHGMRGCMEFGGTLEDYIALVRTLPPGARVVEVGACEGRSIAAVALACLDRDYTFACVESFAGDDDGTFDGLPLPTIAGLVDNLRRRYPFLPVHPVLGRSEQAAAAFADASVDAVFLDASQAEHAVRRDIAAWLPKLKPGGLLAGDDWTWDSVRRAVHAAFDSREVVASPSGRLWSVRRRSS